MLAIDRLVEGLNNHHVRFIIVGGMAVAAHGFVRATKDLDIVPASDRDNLTRLAAALRELDAEIYGLGDFRASEFPFDPANPDDLAEGGNFVLQTNAGRLDVMQWLPGIDADVAFDHLSHSAIDAEILGHPVRVCSLEDLRVMKRTAGRPQDLEDLRHLDGA
jgi:hypothetical protein